MLTSVLTTSVAPVAMVGPVAMGRADAPAQCESPVQAGEVEFASVPLTSEPEPRMDEGADLYRRGAFEEAARSWRAAAEGYAAAGDAGAESDARVRLAHAYRAAGRLDLALAALERARTTADTSGDAARIAAALAAEGEVLLALGQPERAGALLAEAATRAETAGRPDIAAIAQNARGSARVHAGWHEGAIELYLRSAELASEAGDRVLAVSARANAARAAVEAGRGAGLEQRLAEAVTEATALPDSHAKARALLHLGGSYQRLDERAEGPSDGRRLGAAAAFGGAAEVAERIGDRRTASYALGYLAELYERERRVEESLELTRRALFAAQQADAPDAAYLWQWQTGRLARAAGAMDDAIAAYRAAVASLDVLRAEGLLGRVGARGGFGAAVEPVYFGLVDLLLERAAATEDPDAYEALLRESRDTVERLKRAEIRDYFEDECVADRPVVVPDSIPGTVVIYPIPLDDRTELITSLPKGLVSIVVDVGREELTREVRQFRELLGKVITRQYRRPAERLYDLLVRPVEAELGDEPIDTFVFVPGGALRTVPPAALYDREARKFLIEKYAVAVVPGLTLTDPRAIDPENASIFIGGLTEAVQGYPALPSVATEISDIREVFTGPALIDGDFLTRAVEKQLSEQPFRIVHIASHGEFGGRARDSFVLTFDDRITIDELARLIEKSEVREEALELLTLSACQTAAGDDRAALGLAGVAVRSGARSALATLWYISDEASAELVASFYRELRKPGVARAEALRRAQVRFLEDPAFRHPGYWSPFLLIGSWL